MYVFLLLGLLTCGPAPEEPKFVQRLETGVNSTNQLTPTEQFNIVEYLYYYNGGGVAATDINGDSLPDLYFTNNQAPNRYYINQGNWTFRDATEAGGVAGGGHWSTGISVSDVNADGLPDLYVCNVSGYKGLEGTNELFIQQANGTFREQAADYGLAFGGFNTQAYWLDYDLDGDDDMYLLRHSVHNDATYGQASAREVRDSLAGDLLLRNDGGRFTDVTEEMGLYSSKIGYGLSAAVADYDGNGYPDVYVCNDFSENDYLYLNRGGEGFDEVVRERTGHTSNFSMGSDVGDLDRDGRPDLITLDMRPGDEQVLKSTASADAYNVYRLKRRAGYYDQLPRNNVQWNRGGGNFSEVAELAGLAATDWSWSVLVEDFDRDGRAEVFVANGIERRPNDLDYLKFISSSLARNSSNLAVVSEMPPGHVANQLFVEDEPLRYREADWGLALVGSSTGAAVADFDRDGDLDLVVNNVNAPAVLYENRSAADTAKVRASSQNTHTRGQTPQRGFMSQSEVGPSVATLEPMRVRQTYTVEVIDTVSEVPQASTSSFDQQPLQPFEGAIPDRREGAALVGNQPGVRLVAAMWSPIVVTEPGHDAVTLPGTTGWWQSVTPIRTPRGEEFIVGNWGINSQLGTPGPEAPLRLYLGDLDRNGRADPLITYVRGDREYTLADKDELAKQLPAWRRNNLSYTDFSRRDFAENFPDVAAPPQTAETLHHLRVYREGGKGEWRTAPLPRAAQITPLNVALQVPQGILLGGNRVEVLPRVGRQDAAALQLLRPDGRVQFIDLGGSRNRAEVRQLTDTPQGVRVHLHTGEVLLLRLAGE